MLNKLVFHLYCNARILLFRLLSNQSPLGKIRRIQGVQIMGAGRVIALGNVSIGYFPSPHFLSSYGYLEAREKGSKIEIGDNTKINNGFVAIAEKTSITIGENCLIGTRVEIYDSDFHELNAQSRKNGIKHVANPVRIGNDVFIGSNVRILKGVTIGDGCAIGNGSLVINDLPANSLAAGVPARVIRIL